MNAKIIANRLLEDEDDELDPRELLGQALDANKKEKLEQVPESIRPFLEYAPDEFMDAIGDPNKSAEWETEFTYADGDLWPYMWTLDRWNSYTYYPSFHVENGELFININCLDSDGDSDTEDSGVCNEKLLQVLRRKYSIQNWHEHELAYDEWVVQHGEDPLKYYYVRDSDQKIDARWTMEVARNGDGTRFARAWPTKSPKKVITRPEQLPEEIRNYLLLDPATFSMESVWADLLAYDFTDRVEPTEARFDGDTLRLTRSFKMKPTPAQAKRIQQAYNAELTRLAHKSAQEHRQALATASPDRSNVVP